MKKLLNVSMYLIYLLFSVLGKRRDLHMNSFQLSPPFLTSVVEIDPAVLKRGFLHVAILQLFSRG